jgi:signal transduction histidine kinase
LKIKLKFRDNGKGFDSNNAKFGMELDLIKGLLDQVGGDITFDTSKGAETSLLFDCGQRFAYG